MRTLMWGLETMDTNHDGAISREEMQPFVEELEAMDVNHDGSISREETHAFMRVLVQALEAMDTNKDGTVSREKMHAYFRASRRSPPLSLVLILLVGAGPVICLIASLLQTQHDLKQSEEIPEEPRPAGSFSSDLCSCCDDCCSMWTVCFCTPIALSQLVFRLLVPRDCKDRVCVLLLAAIWIFVSWFAWRYGYMFLVIEHGMGPPTEIGKVHLVRNALVLLAAVLICLVRGRIRERDQIPAACCPSWGEDAFSACCCPQLALMQAMRHEGLVGGRYRPCFADGVRRNRDAPEVPLV